MLVVISRRILAVCALWMAGFGLIAWMRPSEGQSRSALPREKFWTIKLNWPPVFDVVAGGDSRVLCDVSPAEIREIVPCLKIANFAFNYVGLTDAYFNALEGKLNPESRTKAIILGITPRALTLLNTRVSGYLEESNRGWFEKSVNARFGSLISLFRPVSMTGLANSIMRNEVGYKDFYPDGWMAVRMTPPNPTADLGVYRTVFSGNMVSPALIRALLDTVRRWQSEGIHVIGFRPPTTREMLALENRLSGFIEEDFRTKFQAAGGTWISFDSKNYQSCDGSHLDSDSARAFSRDLARYLRDNVSNSESARAIISGS